MEAAWPGAGRGGHRRPCRQLGVHRQWATDCYAGPGWWWAGIWTSPGRRGWPGISGSGAGNSMVGKQKGMKGIMGSPAGQPPGGDCHRPEHHHRGRPPG